MSAALNGGPEIGLTGARFGGAARRRATGGAGLLTREPPEPVTEPTPPDAPGSDVGTTGARFAGMPRRRPGHVPSPAPAPPVPRPRPPEPRAGSVRAAGTAEVIPAAGEANGTAGAGEVPESADAGASSFVRPYVITGGRTRSRYPLAVESLVSATPRAARHAGFAEHRTVVALCSRPRSIAEIAAIGGVPLGVARVLVGDLAASGAVVVHRTAGDAGPDLALMGRVLRGLQRL